MAAKRTADLSAKGAQPRSTEKHSVGHQFERKTEVWLSSQGWKLEARNWRCPAGEIDLVFRRHNPVVLVAIEVRYRNSRKFRPSRFLSQAKQNRLHLTARFLAAAKHLPVQIELVEWVGNTPTRLKVP